MIKFVKKAILPMFLGLILVFSIGCDNKNNNNNNGNGGDDNPPATSYEITSSEAGNILETLEISLDSFVAKANDKNVSSASGLTQSMINALTIILNDSYGAIDFYNQFTEGSFNVDQLYTYKTLSTDKFGDVKNTNDEKLSIDLVYYTENQSFENYSYEITVDKGSVKKLNFRYFVTTDTGTTVINMYEADFDFTNSTLQLLYIKPIKNTWVTSEEYLNIFFTEDNIGNVEWGSLFDVKIDLNSTTNLVTANRYIDTLTDTMKEKVIDFSYNDFYQNLAVLATNDESETISDKFSALVSIEHITYNYSENKFNVTD